MSDPEPTGVAKYARQVNDAFVRLIGADAGARLFVRARDVFLWDEAGKEYLDCVAGLGCAGLGHNHPRIAERVRAFLGAEVPNVRTAGAPAAATELARALAAEAGVPLDACVFANRAGEAREIALRLARAATGRTTVLYAGSGLPAGCTALPYGDPALLEKSLTAPGIAALVIEPVAVEAGLAAPPSGWMAKAQEVCRRHGTLLIVDETRVGLGRTGRTLALTAEQISPDALVLGEAIGGGVVPLALVLTRQDLRDRAPEPYGTTLTGLALGCAAALETLAILREEKLAENARARGEQLVDGLKKRLAGHPLVKNVRGRGLLVAVELGPAGEGWVNRFAPFLVELMSENVFGQWAALRLFERGILCRPAAHQGSVLLLEPPLTVRAAEIDRVVQALGEVLEEYQGLGPLVVDVAARLAERFRKAWGF